MESIEIGIIIKERNIVVGTPCRNVPFVFCSENSSSSDAIEYVSYNFVF